MQCTACRSKRRQRSSVSPLGFAYRCKLFLSQCLVEDPRGTHGCMVPLARDRLGLLFCPAPTYIRLLACQAFCSTLGSFLTGAHPLPFLPQATAWAPPRTPPATTWPTCAATRTRTWAGWGWRPTATCPSRVSVRMPDRGCSASHACKGTVWPQASSPLPQAELPHQGGAAQMITVTTQRMMW